MYESTFSYNLKRPYPYPWFTWVVVLGGLAATALFSVVSVAANGFETSTLYVTNPNDTEHPSQPAWFQKRPWSFASKITPKCQDQTLGVGSQILTNNLLFLYEISAVNKMYPNKIQHVGSFAYHNDPWHDCWVPHFSVSVGPSDTNASFVINCTVFDNDIPVTALLKANFNGANYAQTIIAIVDNETESSLWWGVKLLLFTYPNFKPYSTLSAQYLWVFNDADGFVPPTVQTTMQITNNNITTIMDSQLSSLESWSSSFGPDILTQFDRSVEIQGHFSTTKVFWNASDANVACSVFLDGLAKVFYSLVLTDLGQDIKSNFLATPQGIFSYLNATNQTFPSTQWIMNFSSFDNYSFDDPSSQDPTTLFTSANFSLPNVTNASISTEYLCQIPKQKPIGSMIYSVIVANLVFLQALWAFFTWMVKTIHDRQNSAANHCSGCMKSTAEDDSVELVTLLPVTKHTDLPQYHSLQSHSPSSEAGSTTIRRHPVPTSASPVAQDNETTEQLLGPDQHTTE